MIYIDNLKQCLKTLSNEELQRISWLEGNHRAPQEEGIPDIAELVCQTFDDTGLSSILDSPNAQNVLGQEAVVALRKLDQAVSKIDFSMPPQEMMSHPTMIELRRFAKEALVALENRS